MLVLPPRTLLRLADRIERAYLRRRPEATQESAYPGVWTIAAGLLLDLHRADPDMPLDPELFVAAQKLAPGSAQPWIELARPASITAYQRRVRRIVRQLRRELTSEIRHAEKQITRGRSIDTVLLQRDAKLSPLGRYLVAIRAGDHGLAVELQDAAREQHRSCPLYRMAAVELVAPECYPVFDFLPNDSLADSRATLKTSYSLN